MNIFWDCFVVLSDRDFEPKILIKGEHVTKFWKKRIESWIFSLINLKKQKKGISYYYMSPYYFLFYMQWVHGESPKYIKVLPKVTQIKWICYRVKDLICSFDVHTWTSTVTSPGKVSYVCLFCFIAVWTFPRLL